MTLPCVSSRHMHVCWQSGSLLSWLSWLLLHKESLCMLCCWCKQVCDSVRCEFCCFDYCKLIPLVFT